MFVLRFLHTPDYWNRFMRQVSPPLCRWQLAALLCLVVTPAVQMKALPPTFIQSESL